MRKTLHSRSVVPAAGRSPTTHDSALGLAGIQRQLVSSKYGRAKGVDQGEAQRHFRVASVVVALAVCGWGGSMSQSPPNPQHKPLYALVNPRFRMDAARRCQEEQPMFHKQPATNSQTTQAAGPLNSSASSFPSAPSLSECGLPSHIQGPVDLPCRPRSDYSALVFLLTPVT